MSNPTMGGGSGNVLPYHRLVGQNAVKLALELSYVVPRIGGVLLSGRRGTGKSTAVRAFSHAVKDGELPVTLPINATEDRVVGGWDVTKLMAGKLEWKPGLLEDAHGGTLYVDEINLLDDHIVNIILDVASTNILVVQREGGQREKRNIEFTLVGTMNPEEGGLRPQLLDRFGLSVNVSEEMDSNNRRQILSNVLDQDRRQRLNETDPETQQERKNLKDRLDSARERFKEMKPSSELIGDCVALAEAFQVEGHRSDLVLARAAMALAAMEPSETSHHAHLQRVAPLVLQHRRPEAASGERLPWSDQENEKVKEILSHARK
ncbi:MAG: Magnesium chelatase [Magnetococcales bacterium]|nr:Magnesium chelatase [Magnetococcales bacterium]